MSLRICSRFKAETQCGNELETQIVNHSVKSWRANCSYDIDDNLKNGEPPSMYLEPQGALNCMLVRTRCWFQFLNPWVSSTSPLLQPQNQCTSRLQIHWWSIWNLKPGSMYEVSRIGLRLSQKASGMMASGRGSHRANQQSSTFHQRTWRELSLIDCNHQCTSRLQIHWWTQLTPQSTSMNSARRPKVHRWYQLDIPKCIDEFNWTLARLTDEQFDTQKWIDKLDFNPKSALNLTPRTVNFPLHQKSPKGKNTVCLKLDIPLNTPMNWQSKAKVTT